MKFKLVEKIIVSSSEATRSRELQEQRALPASSSRVPRTDNFFTSSYRYSLSRALPWGVALLELTVYFFLNLSLLGQSIELEQNFHYIKDLIDRKQVKEAQRQIDILRFQNENDPTLELYQTEIWIQVGEKNYRESNLKTAFENFKKAYEVYPSNPLVNSRYKELSGKILFDANVETKKPPVPFPFYPVALQGTTNYENSEVVDSKETSWSRIEIILSIICIQNFLILGIYFLRRK